MRKFFDCSSDFFYIINSQLRNVKRILQISTGWTNFVFEVKAKGGKYIFRFPRNDFFSQQLEKECAFLAGVDRRTLPVEVPTIKLCYFKGRPYSVHKALKGKALSECKVGQRKLKKIARQLLKFLDDLAKIQTHVNLPTTSQFLKNLSLVSGGEYDLNKHSALEEEESHGLVLSHGDFNPGNILIRWGRVCGVLDFAFVSRSTPLDDVARIVGRYPQISKYMFDELNKQGAPVDIEERVLALCDVWQYVEERYVDYIKREHRDIILPENLS